MLLEQLQQHHNSNSNNISDNDDACINNSSPAHCLLTEVKKLSKATKMVVDEVSGGMEDDVPLGPGTTLGG